MLHFRLRTLLIAVAVLAVPMAWVGYSLRWIAERRAALRDKDVRVVDHPEADSIRAPAGLWLLGEAGYLHLRHGPQRQYPVHELFPEARISGPNDLWYPFLRPGQKLVIIEEEEALLGGATRRDSPPPPVQ